MITLELIKQIEERAMNASCGPWKVRCRDVPIGDTGDVDCQAEIISPLLYDPGIQIWNPEDEDVANLEFIAASRTDIPRLCATLRCCLNEMADLHATLSAHTNCATDGLNWRMMWQRLCEQRQEAIRNAFDDGMRKAVNAVCEKCGRGFTPLYRTECLQRWGKLPKSCATCVLGNLEAFLSEPDPNEMPPDNGQQKELEP